MISQGRGLLVPGMATPGGGTAQGGRLEGQSLLKHSSGKVCSSKTHVAIFNYSRN